MDLSSILAIFAPLTLVFVLGFIVLLHKDVSVASLPIVLLTAIASIEATVVIVTPLDKNDTVTDILMFQAIGMALIVIVFALVQFVFRPIGRLLTRRIGGRRTTGV